MKTIQVLSYTCNLTTEILSLHLRGETVGLNIDLCQRNDQIYHQSYFGFEHEVNLTSSQFC